MCPCALRNLGCRRLPTLWSCPWRTTALWSSRQWWLVTCAPSSETNCSPSLSTTSALSSCLLQRWADGSAASLVSPSLSKYIDADCVCLLCNCIYYYYFFIISVLCWKPDLLFSGMTDISLVLELLNGMWMWIKITLYTVHNTGMLLHCCDDRCLFTRVVCNIASWLFMLESTSGAICCPAHLTVAHFVGILCLSTNLCLLNYLIVYSSIVYTVPLEIL